MEPAIAIDGAGAVHVTATGADNGGIWYATNASGRWVSEQLVAPWNTDPEMTGSVDEPAIAIDPSDGSIWIAFIYWSCWDCAPGWSDGLYVINNAGGTWSDPAQLAGSDGALYPSLAIRDGHVYATWAVSGDYIHRYGPVTFGTDASGVWEVRQVVGAGAFAHIALEGDGRVGILFGGNVVRYARQRADGSFAIERLAGTSGHVGEFTHPALAIDTGRGGINAAWTGYVDPDHRAVYTASRGRDGWSASMPFVWDAEMIGFGVHDGVTHFLADKDGLIYSTDASGWFVEQIVDASTDLHWGDTAFALLPSGRPIAIITRDEPVARRSGIWILKGPPA